MLRRAALLALAGAAGVAAAVLPAVASEATTTTVQAAALRFTPDAVTVQVGDTVVWNTVEAGHNVRFEGEADDIGEVGANTPSRTFNAPGTFNYYCEPHRSAGMIGSVTVQGAATTQTTTTQTTTTQTTTTQTTTTETTTTPTTTTPAESPQVSVAATRSTFCAKRTSRCRRPGVGLRVESSGPATIIGRLRRRPLRGKLPSRLLGRVRFTVDAGEQTVRFTRTRQRRRVVPGRYTLSLRVEGGDTLPTLAFRVR